MKRNRTAKALKFLVFALVAGAVFGAVVMGLWNWLMPAIFGWSVITFWQALGLLVLFRILFGRFGRLGGRMYGRHRMMGRWNHMTPEERERFSKGLSGSPSASGAADPTS